MMKAKKGVHCCLETKAKVHVTIVGHGCLDLHDEVHLFDNMYPAVGCLFMLLPNERMLKHGSTQMVPLNALFHLGLVAGLGGLVAGSCYAWSD